MTLPETAQIAAAREQAAKDICARLRSVGWQALLAGGCVRDLLLDAPPKDYDIATDAPPEAVQELFGKTVDVGAAFGVTIVVRPEGMFEITRFRKDGPYVDGRHPSYVEFTDAREDAERRDFTINALFLDPETDEVLDFVGGQADIQAGIVRAVGEPARRFAEDHLRLLRAVRFAARLGYNIEAGTWRAMQAQAFRIRGTSAERIRDELLKILTEGRPRQGLEMLDAAGLLVHILPEVSAMKAAIQPPAFHPEGDVFTHTMMMLEALDNPTPSLALATLLHDVGKPLTATYEDRIRFNNHDKVGARVSEDICRRLRLPRRMIEEVGWLVQQHMRLANLPQMNESKRKRFAREPHFDELVELGRLDCVSSHRNVETIDWIREYKANLKPEQVRPAPLLNGKDLIEMGYKPGPRFGEILADVEDKQLEGELETADEARAYVQEHWPRENGDEGDRND